MIIHTIIRMDGGLVQYQPRVFDSEEKALKFFESQVTTEEIGFRERAPQENWLEYYEAFQEYADGSVPPYPPYDTDDIWFYWFEGLSLNDTLTWEN